MKKDAVLYVVATPIGNLGDLSSRAIGVLSDAELIVAEDTRHTGALLTHLGLKKKMISLHAHNEEKQTEVVIGYLESGVSVALVSDAGTPLISDPGFPLVKRAREGGWQVSPIAGPSALIAALSVSGLPCDRFIFEGFLPAKRPARRSRLESLAAESRTLVFYESPHRIQECVLDMSEVFGARREAVVLRELTKKFEQIHSAALSDLLDWLAVDDNHRRGEFVLVVAGSDVEASAKYETHALLGILLAHLHVKEAAAVAAQLTGESKRDMYQLAIELKSAEPD